MRPLLDRAQTKELEETVCGLQQALASIGTINLVLNATVETGTVPAELKLLTNASHRANLHEAVEMLVELASQGTDRLFFGLCCEVPVIGAKRQAAQEGLS